MESDAFTSLIEFVVEYTECLNGQVAGRVTAASRVTFDYRPVHRNRNLVGLVTRPYFGTES